MEVFELAILWLDHESAHTLRAPISWSQNLVNTVVRALREHIIFLLIFIIKSPLGVAITKLTVAKVQDCF